MRVLRYWPLMAIAAALVAAYATGLQHELSWSSLVAHENAVRTYAAFHPVSTPAIYLAVYAAVVAISIPGAVWFTIGGGALFGGFFGTIFAVIGAWIGANLLFLAARSTLGRALAERAGSRLDGIRDRLARDGFSYLLALRLVPVVPFWLTNLAPALVGMRLGPYAAATFLGIIPATAVFAYVGDGLGGALRTGERPDLRIVISPPVLLPLLGLAALSLMPVVVRRLRTARA